MCAMTEIEVQPKKSVWTRTLQLAPGGLFRGLGGLVKLGMAKVTASPSLALAGVTDIVGSVQVTPDAGDQAGLLISRALAEALLKLIDPYKMGFDAAVATDEAGVAAQIDETLRGMQLRIPEDFLLRPRELELLEVVKRKIVEWLQPLSERALGGRHPESIAARLPEYFVYALHQEAIVRRGDYELLFRHFEGKFDEAYRRERSWERYRAWFAQRLQAPMFGDSFSLPQVYVWPRAYHLAESQTARRTRGGVSEPELAGQKARRVVGWLRESLDAWVRGEDRRDAVRVLSGDPGAGKSSFARMFVQHWLEQGMRVVYVPLHRLDLRLSLEKSVEKLCEESEDYPRVEFDGEVAEDRLLLVLDGLDELSKSGRVEARLVEGFADEVLRKVDNRNQTQLRLQVLLCGRPIAVQGVASQFRQPGQVLYLLPYCLTEPERGQQEWVDSGSLLKLDQREAWWTAYGQCTRKATLEIPKSLRSEALLDLTRQPLLGYLLARNHDEALRAGREGAAGRNELYRQLIAQVYAREWGESKGHPVTQMGEEQFFELFEDVAMVAWHDGERLVSIDALERRYGSNKAAILREYAAHCDDVGQLFAAFYLQQYGDGRNEGAFEFTHKSFAEYLAARRMVEQVEVAVADGEARQRETRGRQKPKAVEQTLVEWLQIFGPTAISWDLLPYLDEEVALRDAKQPGTARRWQLGLIAVIENMLREGMPCEQITPQLRFIEARRWARNAEEALLALLCGCAKVTKQVSEIGWPEPTSFGAWIRGLRDQPREDQKYVTVAGGCLARISLQGQQLNGCDLGGAMLDHANLESAVLTFANLESARMEHATLSFADLSNAILYCASMKDAHLANVTLEYANLCHANMDSANLESANLESANLESANLCRANLTSAVLDSSNLAYASLEYACLESAHLKFANLHRAELDWAVLRNATIDSEQLSHTDGMPAVLPDGTTPSFF
jgi:uncharacterized protein YjbI with pentapeptide repeats